MQFKQWILLIVIDLCMASCTQQKALKIQLIEASGQNEAGIVKNILEQGINPDYVMLDGLTPLMNSAKQGSYQAAHVLLAFGANPNYKGDSVTTPSYWAAIHCHNTVLALLLAKGGRLDLPDFAKQDFGNRIQQCNHKELLDTVQAQLKQEGIR